MAVSLSQLKIKELAIHVVQQSFKAAPVAPILGEGLTPVSANNQAFLQERFRSTLKRSRAVLETPDASSPVPALIKNFFDGSADLLTTSRELAVHLQASQKGISPS